MTEDFDLDDNMANFDGGMGDMDLNGMKPPAIQQEGEEKDITSDGGVKKLLVKAGEGWETPEKGDEVSVHYTGTLLDGTKFDSSVDRGKPFTFKLGQGQVIRGWDEGVATMTKGEKVVLTLSPEYAYGESGSPPNIPPNATLKFEVELLSWTSVKDIFGDGGVFKKVLVEGSKYENPGELDEVKVNYVAKLENGTVFSSSPEGGVEFTVKEGHLCPAIGKTITTMRQGDKALLTVKPQYGFGDAGREALEGDVAVPPNATLTIELELLSWKKVEKLTDDGLVVKKMLKEGEGYDRPNDGATVIVKYTAKLADGTVFEKKGYEEEFQFVTDEEQVIAGLDSAILKMKKGELAEVTIAPAYAHGSEVYKGPLAEVPANSTVVYEVELVSFVKDKESWDLDTVGKLAEGAKKKEDGNVLFKAAKYKRAAKKYEKALKYIEYDTSFSEEEKKQSKALKVSCSLNNAACKLKLEEPEDAIKLCNKVLELETQNTKALFRRAQAYVGVSDYTLALFDIKKALEIDPENKDLLRELKVVKRKEAEANKREAKLYGNMFARLSKLEEKELGVKAQKQPNVEAEPKKEQMEDVSDVSMEDDKMSTEAMIDNKAHDTVAAA